MYTKLNHGQSRPSDFLAALKSQSFINALFEFLRDEWSSKRCADLITGHIFHFAYGPCYTYMVCLLVDMPYNNALKHFCPFAMVLWLLSCVGHSSFI